jgi:hypothetical protein
MLFAARRSGARAARGLLSLIRLWSNGASVLPFSLAGCWFTCIGSTLANAAHAGWQDSLNVILLKIAIGYVGAAVAAVVALPLLRALVAKR